MDKMWIVDAVQYHGSLPGLRRRRRRSITMVVSSHRIVRNESRIVQDETTRRITSGTSLVDALCLIHEAQST